MIAFAIIALRWNQFKLFLSIKMHENRELFNENILKLVQNASYKKKRFYLITVYNN